MLRICAPCTFVVQISAPLAFKVHLLTVGVGLSLRPTPAVLCCLPESAKNLRSNSCLPLCAKGEKDCHKIPVGPQETREKRRNFLQGQKMRSESLSRLLRARRQQTQWWTTPKCQVRKASCDIPCILKWQQFPNLICFGAGEDCGAHDACPSVPPVVDAPAADAAAAGSPPTAQHGEITVLQRLHLYCGNHSCRLFM